VTDLVAFLRARLDEDETVANEAAVKQGEYWHDWMAGQVVGSSTPTGTILVGHVCGPRTEAIGSHIARHDPARVLREVEAKRRIVSLERDWPYGSGDPEGAEYGWSDVMDRVLRLLALPYSDHPDYDESWKP